jgi:4-amino-4-deoxy-L-arabinose transferase-like glycosyltransferase
VSAERGAAAERRADLSFVVTGVRALLPVLVAVPLVVPSIVWVSLDRSIWPWDPAWYGEVSVDLWATLRTNPHHWPYAMTHAFGLKPPAIAWLGQLFVPFGAIVGRDGPALLLSVIACQAATLGLVYAALRRLAGDTAALLGALLVAGSPLFGSMSHEYFAEPIQTLAVAWLLLILAAAAQRRPALTGAQLPGVLALGMLAKLSSPAYLAAPAVGAVLLVLLHRGGGPHQRRPWQDIAVVSSAIVSAVIVVGAVSWYRINLHAAIRHARDASADTGLYGVDRGFFHQFPDWVERLRDATFLPHVWLVLAALTVAALVLAAQRRPRTALRDPRVVTAVSCLVSIIVVLATFASQPNQEVRYMLPLVPLLAAPVALGLRAARSRAIVAVALGVVTIEYLGVTLQGFGYAQRSSLVSYPIASLDRGSAFANVLDGLITRTCVTESASRINMVGGDYPWFNANTLEMLAFERYAESGRRCYYTSLGYAEKDPRVAWKRVGDFNPPFYISIDYGNPHNPLPREQTVAVARADAFNRVDLAVFNRVKRSPKFEVVSYSRGGGFVVFRAVDGN